MGYVCIDMFVRMIFLSVLSHLIYDACVLCVWFYIELYLLIFQGKCYSDVMYNDVPEYTYSHDDVIKWKRFPRYWPFVRGIHRSPAERPGTRSFDVFFDLRLNKRLSKQSCGW